MKKSILLFAAILVLFPLVGTTSAGIPGATDRVKAASLLVPFFEVGISSPHDTILVVNSASTIDRIIHYEVWSIDGVATDLVWGNETLDPGETWAVSMADLISTKASASDKTLLTDGAYYHGFVTIDLVSSSTDRTPKGTGYPFQNSNYLEGYIYYARLLQGSANGLDMIPIEYVGSSVDANLRDFYQTGDSREQIDSRARQCAEALIYGETSCPPDSSINHTDSRVYLDPSFNAASRIIIFTWAPNTSHSTEGPSVYCDTAPCASTYTYIRRDEDGVVRHTQNIRLDHVVNIIDVTGTRNGWVRIYDIPSAEGAFQFFAFSFNSASSANISTNYDAIFESYIMP